RAIELHKLTNHTMLTQHIGNRQHQVGGGSAFRHLTCQLETHNTGNQHGNGLAQHGGFGLDTAYAPGHHAQTVHHGRVRVRAHTGVGIGQLTALLVACKDYASQVFQVHLVNNTCARWHDLEVIECTLAPAQEL